MKKQNQTGSGSDCENSENMTSATRCPTAQLILSNSKSGMESQLTSTQRYDESDTAAKWLHDSKLVQLDTSKVERHEDEN